MSQIRDNVKVEYIGALICETSNQGSTFDKEFFATAKGESYPVLKVTGVKHFDMEESYTDFMTIDADLDKTRIPGVIMDELEVPGFIPQNDVEIMLQSYTDSGTTFKWKKLLETPQPIDFKWEKLTNDVINTADLERYYLLYAVEGDDEAVVIIPGKNLKLDEQLHFAISAGKEIMVAEVVIPEYSKRLMHFEWNATEDTALPSIVDDEEAVVFLKLKGGEESVKHLNNCRWDSHVNDPHPDREIVSFKLPTKYKESLDLSDSRLGKRLDLEQQDAA